MTAGGAPLDASPACYDRPYVWCGHSPRGCATRAGRPASSAVAAFCNDAGRRRCHLLRPRRQHLRSFGAGRSAARLRSLRAVRDGLGMRSSSGVGVACRDRFLAAACACTAGTEGQDTRPPCARRCASTSGSRLASAVPGVRRVAPGSRSLRHAICSTRAFARGRPARGATVSRIILFSNGGS